MKKKEYAWLEEFLSNGCVVNISLESPLFDRSSLSVLCTFNYTLTLSVADRKIVKKEIKDLFFDNPFVNVSEILKVYRNRLEGKLRWDFSSYCTVDGCELDWG